MSAHFNNGAWVSRVWADNSGEVIAGFQYFADACGFAERKAAEGDRPASCSYVVCHTLNGEMKIYRPPAEKQP